MTENQIKSPKKNTPLVPLFHTILAAENKTSELFVKSFQYQGENIATKHLGQIFGFFEIPDTQEDNAYIVNFLASVVKKEYFVNPKRSATDSFEAALHKVNLALTELVKQGNTGWLGKLHGVVSVIENNNFHFSVTGDAAILLYRENQVTLISEGLADKDAATHPLKTFLEISSGSLNPEDKILITSPELFTLCEPEVLRRNAFRMDKNGFARYVRAALVNELPLGISIIIDLDVAPAQPRPKKKAEIFREESREKLQNVFSSTPFLPSDTPVSDERPPLEVPEEEDIAPIEYTDKKTGHIYVQGEMPSGRYTEPSSWHTFLEEYLWPAVEAVSQFTKRLTKKSRKAVVKKVSLLGTEGKELGQTLWKLSREKGSHFANHSNQVIKTRVQSFKERQIQKKNLATMEAPHAPSFTDVEENEEFFDAPALPEESPAGSIRIAVPETLAEPSAPQTKRQMALERFSPHYEWQRKSPKENSILQKTKSLFNSLVTVVTNFSSKQKKVFGLFVSGLIILILGLVFLPSSEESTTVTTEAPPATTPAETQIAPATTPALSNEATRASWTEGEGLLVLTTDESTVVVTPKALIVNSTATPFAGNGTIETATYMPDLRMIFLWSSAQELASWSIVDKKFAANTLPLPAGTTVDSMGAYLTYLYTLDATAGTIHRFARTEGGFSEPTSWLKTPLAKDSVQALTVNDTIRVATSTSVDQYLRGTKEKTLASESYQVLGNSSNKTFTLAVATTSGKLTIWDADGNQVYEGTHEELTGIQAVTYNETTKKLLVTKGQNLLEYSLSW